jgi:hypothetical protein
VFKFLIDHLLPVFNVLAAMAADAHHFYLDDTTHKIIEQAPTKRKNATATS